LTLTLSEKEKKALEKQRKKEKKKEERAHKKGKKGAASSEVHSDVHDTLSTSPDKGERTERHPLSSSLRLKDVFKHRGRLPTFSKDEKSDSVPEFPLSERPTVGSSILFSSPQSTSTGGSSGARRERAEEKANRLKGVKRSTSSGHGSDKHDAEGDGESSMTPSKMPIFSTPSSFSIVTGLQQEKRKLLTSKLFVFATKFKDSQNNMLKVYAPLVKEHLATRYDLLIAPVENRVSRVGAVVEELQQVIMEWSPTSQVGDVLVQLAKWVEPEVASAGGTIYGLMALQISRHSNPALGQVLQVRMHFFSNQDLPKDDLPFNSSGR
jgi:hypothetical protein